MTTSKQVLEVLKIYKSQNASKYGIEQMGIFGSVARSEQNEGSDVDIFFIGKPIGLFALAHIKHELENLLLTSVDVIRLQERLNQRLLNRIHKEGIYV